MAGRHRKRNRFRGAGAIAAATALLVVAGGSWFGYQRWVQPGCSGQVRLNVAAAPELASAIQAAAAGWVRDGATVDGVCVEVEITSADPVDVAAVVAGQHGVTLAGVGQASGTTQTPDVWIPDSSSWLVRISNAASGFAPTNTAPVARSPVVLAMPEPVAAAVGWPEKQLTWAELLRQVTAGAGLRTGIVEPSRDATGLSGLLALVGAAAASGANSQEASTSALRALATGRSALRQDLLARFPRSADAAAIASALSAAPLSEEDVIGYNAKRPAVPLAALYLDPAPMSLDYPFAVMPGTDPIKAAAADVLFTRLGSANFRDRLGAQGLRGADGVGGAGFTAPRGAPAVAEAPVVPSALKPTEAAPTPSPDASRAAASGFDPEVMDQLLSTWAVVTMPSRMLAVLDISGSMLQRVPTADNATRMQVTLQAAQRGLALFDDSTAVGIWTFSTELVGSRDYRELVPIGPLSSQRGKIIESLNTIEPKPTGDTGLYDTLLAAYKTVQDGWEPGRVNSVVMMTDGRNDDANGISQAKLLAELKRLADPEQPIQVIIIGIGKDVSQAELESVTKITGGGVFVTEDPAKIGDILLKAISLRPATIR